MRGQCLNHQFISGIAVFVEATDSNTGNTGFLHHIGNADAFEAEFTNLLAATFTIRMCVSALSLFE